MRSIADVIGLVEPIVDFRRADGVVGRDKGEASRRAIEVARAALDRDDPRLWNGVTLATKGRTHAAILVGDPAQVMEALMRYHAAGVTHFILTGSSPLPTSPRSATTSFPACGPPPELRHDRRDHRAALSPPHLTAAGRRAARFRSRRPEGSTISDWLKERHPWPGQFAARHPDRVRKVIFDGIVECDDAMLEEIVARYAPVVEPDDYGRQLLWAFNFVRDQALYFPYFKRDPEHRLGGAMPSAAVLHRAALDVLKALETLRNKPDRAPFHRVSPERADSVPPRAIAKTPRGCVHRAVRTAIVVRT